MSWATCYSSDNNSQKFGWENCYSASNNYNFNFPALMADSRIWSSWQPDAVINKRIQKQEGIKSNFQYRNYLQHNGLHIMNYNTK
jgi:hypothetical protein